MDYKKLADLLFPEIDLTVEDLLKKYPKRDLPKGAEVTRFAPSPTGYLHIGGVYQCALARFIASSTEGRFMLRIEDTDQKREVEGAADIIYPALKNFDILPDEGYVSQTEEIGDYGPYLQSRRNTYYQVFAKELVAKGLAYPCFCQGDEEEESSASDYRAEQKRLGVPIGYYGQWAKCRNLTLEQVEDNLKQGKTFKIRIKSNGDGFKRMIFVDELRGKISFPINFVDYVILKSDKTALYHLAHLVDDTLMHTTMVTRDESWLPSAPLHIQLFEYMNLPHPKYLHTPTLMTIDSNTQTKRKISKRYDAWADCRWFIEKGYYKATILEYLLNLLNSNFEIWRTQNPMLPATEFKLSVSKMGKSGALFDLVKFNDISKTIISKLSNKVVYEEAVNWSKNYDKELYELLTKDSEYSLKMLNIEREIKKPRKDIEKWSDIKTYYFYFFDELFQKGMEYEMDEKWDKELVDTIMEKYLATYNENDEKDVWFGKIKDIAGEIGFATDMKEYKANPDNYKGSYGDVSSIIRVVLTSRKNTPDLYEICALLKKDRMAQRKELYNKR
ncbi:MAG: glutamate--tRNA ligase [Clostridia bacterium]|nr:glutamate--tRNA ligase [Clostridia bacterium]